jgi:hypothetical protein
VPPTTFWDSSYPPSVLALGKPLATGATAGIPGTWTPAGSRPPAGTAMQGVTATPATTWTTGQHVVCSDGAHRWWSGTAWAAGDAAAAARDTGDAPAHKTSKRHPKPPDPDVPADK